LLSFDTAADRWDKREICPLHKFAPRAPTANSIMVERFETVARFTLALNQV
jgi:hypothetical protein